MWFRIHSDHLRDPNLSSEAVLLGCVLLIAISLLFALWQALP